MAKIHPYTTLRIHTHMLGDTPLLSDTSTPIFCPLVPQSLRHTLFQHVYGLAHPGIRATRCLLSAYYVWPHLAKDVSAWCHTCLSCQTGKVHHHTHLRPVVILLPVTHFSHINVDLVGSLPPPPATPTCSPSLTTPPAGLRLSLFPPPPPMTAPPP